MCGQDIAEEIEKRKGSKPSPGTIYPALKYLREEGFISESKCGKTIVYELTEDGKQALKVAKAQFCKTFVGIFN